MSNRGNRVHSQIPLQCPFCGESFSGESDEEKEGRRHDHIEERHRTSLSYKHYPTVGISPEWVIEESRLMFTKEMGFDPTDHLLSKQMENAVSVVGLRMYILGHQRGFALCQGSLQTKSPRKGGKH